VVVGDPVDVFREEEGGGLQDGQLRLDPVSVLPALQAGAEAGARGDGRADRGGDGNYRGQRGL